MDELLLTHTAHTTRYGQTQNRHVQNNSSVGFLVQTLLEQKISDFNFSVISV